MNYDESDPKLTETREQVEREAAKRGKVARYPRRLRVRGRVRVLRSSRGRVVITRAHILARTIAALSGGVLACETAPAQAARPMAIVFYDFADPVVHFRHNGNDCYVYRSHGIACVRAEGGR